MEKRGKEPIVLFNIRFVPLFAAFLILGIYCVKLSTAVAAISFACAAVFLFLLVRTKSFSYKTAIALAAFMILGFAISSLAMTLYNDYGLDDYVTIECRVIEVTKKENDFGKVTYRVVADSIRHKGDRKSGKVTFSTDEKMTVGDRVLVNGDVSINKLSLKTAFSAMQYRVGVKYSMADALVGSVEHKAPPLSYTIRKKARETLVRYESDRAGTFTYAMLFGDSSAMLSSDKEAMRSIGVAHVFAVSGLHVGVLSAAILFLLRKFRAKNWVLFFVMLPILGFYSYVCDFTPSVLRASIMVLLSLAASAIGMRYDSLSSISFAAIAILLIKPLYLFDLSFIMSFLSVLGILSLARPLERAFTRRKMKKGFASALSVSLSTTIALAPVSAIVFGKITFVGIVMNLVVVPLASVTYVLSLFSLLLTIVYSGFGELLIALRFLPVLIADVSVFASKQGVPQNYAFATAEIALYYLTIVFVGNYSLAYRRVKLITAGVASCLMLALIFA